MSKIGLILQQLLTLPFAMCNGYHIKPSKPPHIESVHIGFALNMADLQPKTFTDILYLDCGKDFYITSAEWNATPPPSIAYNTLVEGKDNNNHKYMHVSPGYWSMNMFCKMISSFIELTPQ